MNPEEAQLILHCRRPQGQDDHDPVIAEALACLHGDAAASEVLHANGSIDQLIGEHVRSTPVPAGLRGNILAGRRMGAKPRRFHPAWLAAAAAIAIAAPLAWKFWPAQNGEVLFASTTLSDFRRATTRKLSATDIHLHKGSSIEELKPHLQAGTPAVPESLCHCPGGMLGCEVFKWEGNQVTLICFDAGSIGEVHLFTVDAAALKDSPGGRVYETADGWNTLAWTCPCSGKIMLLAGEAKRTTHDDLDRLIAAAK